MQMIEMSKVLCFGLKDISLLLFLFDLFSAVSNNVAWFFAIMAYDFGVFSVLLIVIWVYGCHFGYC